jgi:hypothetical protein
MPNTELRVGYAATPTVFAPPVIEPAQPRRQTRSKQQQT